MDSINPGFRNLCINHYMPDFDYINTKFSFQTVFFRTHYSYCCCACGYEHEYLDYISDTGEIDESMYDGIVKCIENGKCPHVDSAPAKFVKETSIYAIHIAAAVGTREAVLHHIRHFRNVKSGIYKLGPYITAAMKRRHLCVGLYFNGFPENYPIEGGFFILHATRSKRNTHMIKIKRLSLLELCVKKRDIELLNNVLNLSISHANFHRAYELTHKFHLDDMQDALIEYDRKSLDYRRRILNTGNIAEGSACAIPAIVCNQPEVLDRVLQFSPAHKLSTHFKCSLNRTCHVLQRQECEEILSKYDIADFSNEISILSKLKHLLHLFTFYQDFRQEITCAIRDIPNLVNAINTPMNDDRSSFQSVSMMGPLHSYILENKILDPEIIKAMLDFGADVDVSDFYGNSALIHLVKERWWYCEGFRETLELLIFENPSLYLNRSAVYLGLKQDSYTKSTWNLNLANMAGNFLMDARLRSLFGHDEEDTRALNFTAPLLIECGFFSTTDTLLKAQKESLDPVELLYIKRCIEKPRSLKLCCRDSLRRHFRGRGLHKFLADSFIPNRLKDFILLKSTLLSVN